MFLGLQDQDPSLFLRILPSSSKKITREKHLDSNIVKKSDPDLDPN
jgi:hypothetical protein